MAFFITTQLSRLDEIITAISAMAQGALQQSSEVDQAPHWAITIDLLATLAKDELEVVHNSLQFELPGGDDNAPA